MAAGTPRDYEELPGMKRYQNRFTRVGEKIRRGGYVVTDLREVARWKQYYLDQRARILLDSELSEGQKKQIRSCENLVREIDRFW
jgi:hypothetical protein